MAVVFASAARLSTNDPHNADFLLPTGARGFRAQLDITAASGTTPTLDVKFQYYNAAQDEWEDLKGFTVANAVAFAQKTAAGETELIAYPNMGVADVANSRINVAPPRKLRAVATLGADADESFTFSLNVDPLY